MVFILVLVGREARWQKLVPDGRARLPRGPFRRGGLALSPTGDGHQVQPPRRRCIGPGKEAAA